MPQSPVVGSAAAMKCSGCKRAIDDGNVIAFGDRVWHLECFRCGKCNDLVEHDASSLVLADGSPICEKCGYVCHACHKPIYDQAVLTGDTPYHEECFRCKTCNTRIDNLVYTKAADGSVQCVSCAGVKSPVSARSGRDGSDSPILPRVKAATSLSSSSIRQFTAKSTDALDTSTPSGGRDDAVAALQDEVDMLRQKLAHTEESLEKIKVASRSAIEHFNQTKADLARETALRERAEGEARSLRHELDKNAELIVQIRQENVQLLHKADSIVIEAMAGASQLGDLENDAHKLRLECDMKREQVKELEVKRQQLLADIDRLAKQRQEALVRSDDVRLSTSEAEQQERIRQEFRTEMESLQKARTSLQREIATLQQTKQTLVNKSSTAESSSSTNRPEVHTSHGDGLNVGSTPFKSTSLPPTPVNPLSPLSPSSSKSNLSPGMPSPKPSSMGSRRPIDGSNASLSGDVGSVNNLGPERNGKEGANKMFKFLNKKKESNVSSKDLPAIQQQQTPPHGKTNRQHNFQVQQFLVPQTCKICNEKIWGMKAKDVQCRDCAFPCHVKCSAKAAADCTGGNHGPVRPPVFGSALEELSAAEGRLIPAVVSRCISEVEKRGLKTEGIYRKSGLQSQMKLLMDAFNSSESFGQDLDLTEDAWPDIHVICGCLKVWFRNMSVPITTFEYFPVFVDASLRKSPGEKKKAFVSVLSALSPPYYHTIRCLMLHLHTVASNFSHNLMSYRNLSVVFGPNLLRSHAVDSNTAMNDNELTDMGYKNAITEYMIEEAPALFADCDRIRAEDDSAGSIAKHNVGNVNMIVLGPGTAESTRTAEQFAMATARSATSATDAALPRNMNAFMLSSTVTAIDTMSTGETMSTVVEEDRRHEMGRGGTSDEVNAANSGSSNSNGDSGNKRNDANSGVAIQ